MVGASFFSRVGHSALDVDDYFAQTQVVEKQMELACKFRACRQSFDDTRNAYGLARINRYPFHMLRTEAAISVSAMAYSNQTHGMPGGISNVQIDQMFFHRREFAQVDIL
ncbi:hypothetical protein HRbin36_01556 [bacterium HR36]|nr:hypothetical protein HRbin36_01556 [bacterium HR36]